MKPLRFFAFLGFAWLATATAGLAADDPFTVSGIPVDASAASASVAQNIAINDGRGRAWTMLYRRITKAQDWPRQPQLDDLSLQRIVRNYLVANERRSTTRFVASMTYVFNADAVKRLLRSQNIPYVDLEAKPVLVVPMAPGYASRSAWSSLWANPKYANGAVPMVLPLGDPIDRDALAPLNFATAQWQDVEPIASRVHATEAYLVQAVPGKGNVTVAIRRLGPGGSPPIPNVVVTLKPGDAGTKAYGAAADQAAAAIVDAWKAHSAIDFNKRSKLTADVRVQSLADWGTLLQKLATVPTVTDVNVLAMNMGEARLAITYAGSSDQLEAFFAQAGLDLADNDSGWELSMQAPPSNPTPQSQ